MEQEEIIQESLNIPKRYFVSITQQKEEMKEDCANYKICIYQRRVGGRGSNFIFPKNIREFEIKYIGDWDKFLLNLKLGIEKRIDQDGLRNWARGK